MQTPDLDAVQHAVGDRYEVLSLAGVGGMGAVFRARHRTLGHIVAVKVLPPDVAASTMRHERFRREATLGASLDHPNIVRVYDFDTREGISFLIMTFVRGDTFEERLRNDARVPTDHILRMVREIADALGYAHRRGIVHRDVKPSNILPDEASGRAWLAALARAEVRPWRPWAAAGVLAVGSAVALRLLLAPHGACRLPRDAPARLAVMPFAVLGTPPYPATQLPEYFISRFRPVEHLSEVVSFGRVVAQIASEHPSNEEAQALACRLGAKFFVQGSVAYVGPTVTLQATLYEGGRARRSAKAEGRVGAEESEMMDRVWTGLYPEFTPGADATLPNGGPEALAAYLNAEAAFRRGDYRTARDEYTRVIRADSGFAIGRLRLALVAAQVDPTEQGFGAALRGALVHQQGLSPADSLLLDGFTRLLVEGDGLAARDRFKRATEQAPSYPQAWYVLGEFYYHFAGLFDETVGEAGVAFNRVLDLDPRFAPAIR